MKRRESKSKHYVEGPTKYDWGKDYRDTYRHLECVTNPDAGGVLILACYPGTFRNLGVNGYLTGAALLEFNARYGITGKEEKQEADAGRLHQEPALIDRVQASENATVDRRPPEDSASAAALARFGVAL